MPTTKERLANEMKAAGVPQDLIDAALKGRYDDFESPSATPISDLVYDLTQAGFRALAQRAANGEFDNPGNEPPSKDWRTKRGI